MEYAKFIKTPKYRKDLNISEKKTAFKIFQENSMASKEKLMKIVEEKKLEPTLNIQLKQTEKKVDFDEINLSTEESVGNDFDAEEVLINIETLNIQDEIKSYFIYDYDLFVSKASKDLIKNESFIVDARKYLEKNNNFDQFLNLLEIFKERDIKIYVDTHDIYYMNSLNKFLLEYKMLLSFGELESVYDEPKNTSYLSNLGLFAMPKNLNIFEKINKNLNIENYINPMYFNIKNINNPIMDELALNALREIENGHVKIIDERDKYLKEKRQEIIDDEIAVFYSTYSYEIIQSSFVEGKNLKNSKVFPILPKEFLAIPGPKNQNLLFRDNRLIIDGKYINDSERREFYSIAFVSLKEEDKNERSESSWAELMELNSLNRAIFNISSKTLSNIFKNLNNYEEGYVFNKTRLEYNKEALEVAKKFGIEGFESIQPTILVASSNKSDKLELDNSSQFLIYTNPKEFKKKIYFLYNDWTEEKSPIYVEEDYIGNDEEYDIIKRVKKERNRNLHQFLEQVTIFEHLDAFVEQIKINEIDFDFNRNINKKTRNILIEKILESNPDINQKLLNYIYSDNLFLIEFQKKLNKEALEKYKISEFPFYSYDSIKDFFYLYLNEKWVNRLDCFRQMYKKEKIKQNKIKEKIENYGLTEQQKILLQEEIETIDYGLKIISDAYLSLFKIKNIRLKKEYILIDLILEEITNMNKQSMYENTDIEDFIEQDRKNKTILLGGNDE